jgi:tetratricopeptide (TPR) repeat protein
MSQTSFSRFARFAVLAGVLALAACSRTPEEKAQRYYDRAMEFIAKKDDFKARVELRNALQAKSDMLPAWRALVGIEERLQNWQVAFTTSRKVAELDPKDMDALLRLGRLGLMGNVVDEALKWINAAIELDERNVTAQTLKAAAQLRLNDRSGAVASARKALAVEPANAEAMVVLAAERMVADDFDGALKILDQVPAANQNDLGIIFFKIRSLEKLQNFAEVEKLLRKLIALRPNDVVFKHELVKFYVGRKDPEQAERELRAIAAGEPAKLEHGIAVARFLYGTKGPDAARQELEARIAAGGRVFAFQMALAEFDIGESKFADAATRFAALIKASTAPDDIAAARTRLADLSFSQKNLAGAESVVADLLKADARSVAGLRLRGMIRIEQGRTEEAVGDLRQALNDQPKSAELLMLLGRAYERSGSIELADKNYSDAMKASSYAPQVGLDYVTFLERRGLRQHGENVLTELATRNPGETRVLSALAQAKLARQDWVGAQEIAETLRKRGDQAGTADQILAAVLGGQRKYEQSLGVLQSAQAANPNALQPMYALVRTYIQAQRADRAEAFLQSVLKANPANADAYVLLGFTQLARNAPSDAEKSFNTAIERQPKGVGGYQALADLHLRRGNRDAAVAVVRAGLAQLPGNSVLRLIEAGTLELKGDFDGAIAAYEVMLKDEPGSMVVANNLASLLSDQRTDKASLERAAVVAARLRNSPLPQFKDTLGWIHFQRGDHKAAVPLLEEAARDLPNVALVRYHLAMAYGATDQQGKAADQLRQALELAKEDAGLKTKIAQALTSLPKTQ